MSKLTDNIENIIKKDIETLGYEIEYIEYVKEGENKIFRVVIDKACENLTTEDCEKVSRAIEEKVDNSLSGEEAYILEVSSPGLERALKNVKLYKKYTGQKVKIKLYKKQDELKEITGILEEATDSYITLLVGDEKIQVQMENISCGNTVYEF